MHPKPPLQVKLFSGILFSQKDRFQNALKLLSQRYGPIDYRSDNFLFEQTDYYVPEMGSPIYRCFVSFETLISPDEITRIKLKCNETERALLVDSLRKVNLDPGYLDYDKVVLASAKYNSNKVYLDQGIWADLTLFFERGAYHAYPWSFPDFKTGRYASVFLEIRRLYKLSMRKQSAL